MACNEGAKVTLVQTSVESPVIFSLFMAIFSAQSASSLVEAALSNGSSKEDGDDFVMYAATFFSNMGNYKSFGDTKFIPRIDSTAFFRVIEASVAYKTDRAFITGLWEKCKDKIYSLESRDRQLGLGADAGVSAYFDEKITEKDAAFIQRFLDSENISPYNTRLFFNKDGNYEVRVASEEVKPSKFYTFEDKTIELKWGDYSPLMGRINVNLAKAEEFAANDNQRSMLQKYVSSFATGSIEDHIDGSRFWVKDKGPVVETYIGFIESYRDPFGTRGEFEGFVAVVNREMSAKFATLVDNAERLLPLLPWGAHYEKDRFLRPDFTSLEVVIFSGSGIPAGNYFSSPSIEQ
jgi:dipeptidyl-peptidase-3